MVWHKVGTRFTVLLVVSLCYSRYVNSLQNDVNSQEEDIDRFSVRANEAEDVHVRPGSRQGSEERLYHHTGGREGSEERIFRPPGAREGLGERLYRPRQHLHHFGQRHPLRGIKPAYGHRASIDASLREAAHHRPHRNRQVVAEDSAQPGPQFAYKEYRLPPAPQEPSHQRPLVAKPEVEEPYDEKLDHEEESVLQTKTEDNEDGKKMKDKNQKKPEKKEVVDTVSVTEEVTTATPAAPVQAARKQEVSGDLLKTPASMADIYFLAIVAGCSVAGIVGLVVAGVCWYRFQKDVKAASEVEYPAYGVTGPNKERVQSPGDRKLAQSAQMYHYQHQKQQMIALEKANGEMKHDASDDDSEEENEEGDYTVYECPGLAPTGEMEVKNPLFTEDGNNSAPPASGPTHPTSGVAPADK